MFKEGTALKIYIKTTSKLKKNHIRYPFACVKYSGVMQFHFLT